jgi:hypothetical protein
LRLTQAEGVRRARRGYTFSRWPKINSSSRQELLEGCWSNWSISEGFIQMSSLCYVKKAANPFFGGHPNVIPMPTVTSGSPRLKDGHELTERRTLLPKAELKFTKKNTIAQTEFLH